MGQRCGAVHVSYAGFSANAGARVRWTEQTATPSLPVFVSEQARPGRDGDMAGARLSDPRDPHTLGRSHVRGRVEVPPRLGDKDLCFVCPTLSATMTMTDDTGLGNKPGRQANTYHTRALLTPKGSLRATTTFLTSRV